MPITIILPTSAKCSSTRLLLFLQASCALRITSLNRLHCEYSKTLCNSLAYQNSCLNSFTCFMFSNVSSVVVASASILRASSIVLILSRKFSFFKPLRFLYCLVLSPDHALVTSSVRIANSLLFSIPCSFHVSVSSLRARIVCSL